MKEGNPGAGDHADPRHGAQSQVSLTKAEHDEVADLTWALLDRNISDQQMRRLESLLVATAEARDVYLNCVQIHVDLYEKYAEQDSDGDFRSALQKPPILAILSEGQTPAAAPEETGS